MFSKRGKIVFYSVLTNVSLLSKVITSPIKLHSPTAVLSSYYCPQLFSEKNQENKYITEESDLNSDQRSSSPQQV